MCCAFLTSSTNSQYLRTKGLTGPEHKKDEMTTNDTNRWVKVALQQ